MIRGKHGLLDSLPTLGVYRMSDIGVKLQATDAVASAIRLVAFFIQPTPTV